MDRLIRLGERLAKGGSLPLMSTGTVQQPAEPAATVAALASPVPDEAFKDVQGLLVGQGVPCACC